jgi:hypothetical protein
MHIQNTLFHSISVISPVKIETRTGIFGTMHIKYMDTFFKTQSDIQNLMKSLFGPSCAKFQNIKKMHFNTHSLSINRQGECMSSIQVMTSSGHTQEH